ncbi:hemolysin D [Echinicola pacifica]|uniref:Hemolysin D n=1 Tax=Echinicola pacifica TaxID=346377 RepID=A0A918UMQ1_9BACT|nr:efflux RND transporter periplasmic adaptor subunit [Echinicola pacifica]GGZ21085.1 hemolysin D [Echinicola pacifica]
MKNIIFVLTAVILISGCGKKGQKKQAPVRQVPVVMVVNKDLQGSYTFPTEFMGKVHNEVRPKISGYIQEVYIEEGQKVSKGQMLFRLETNIQTENAAAARAEINASQAAVQAAEASVQAAQVNVDKLIPLVEQNIISNVLLETARADLLKAKGQLSQAKAGYGTSQANFKGIEEDIKFSEITSTMDGVLGRINYRTGSLVSPNDPKPLTTISDISEVSGYFALNEKQYIYFFQHFEGKNLEEKIQNLPPVQLILPNGSIYEETGKVQAATGEINPNTGSIQFRVVFENQSEMLKNGSTGTIKIPRDYKQALVIPESATFERQGITYVYKVLGDSLSMQTITLKDRVSNYGVVEEGLSAQDQIVATGVATLRAGMHIKPKTISLDSMVQSIKAVR